jgi:lipopolysaccharide export system protein LptA
MCRVCKILQLASLLGLLVTGNVVAAQAQQPIYIESHSLAIDEKQGLSHYRGKVKFTQGNLVIRASEIKVFTRHGLLEKVEIKGNPSQLHQQPEGQQHPVIASAQRIEYSANEEILELFGNVLVKQGSQRFSGEHIKYNTRSAQVTAHGGSKLSPENDEQQGRVKATITPGKGK